MVKLPEAVLIQFREWGKQGGKARKKALSRARRVAIAKLAVAAREAKRANGK